MNNQPGIAAATIPPTFTATIFNDPSNDPDTGNYVTLLAPFFYDTANANNNLNLPELRALVNGRANNMDAQAMGILVEDDPTLEFMGPYGNGNAGTETSNRARTTHHDLLHQHILNPSGNILFLF